MKQFESRKSGSFNKYTTKLPKREPAKFPNRDIMVNDKVIHLKDQKVLQNKDEDDYVQSCSSPSEVSDGKNSVGSERKVVEEAVQAAAAQEMMGPTESPVRKGGVFSFFNDVLGKFTG